MTDLIDIGQSFGQGVRTGAVLEDTWRQRDIAPIEKQAAQQKVDLYNLAIGERKQAQAEDTDYKKMLSGLSTGETTPTTTTDTWGSKYESPINQIVNLYGDTGDAAQTYQQGQQQLQNEEAMLKRMQQGLGSVPTDKLDSYSKMLKAKEDNLQRLRDKQQQAGIKLADQQHKLASVMSAPAGAIVDNLDKGDVEGAKVKWDSLRSNMVDVFKQSYIRKNPFKAGMVGPDGNSIQDENTYNQTIQKVAEQHADQLGITSDFTDAKARMLYGTFTDNATQARNTRNTIIAQRNADKHEVDIKNANARAVAATAAANRVTVTGNTDDLRKQIEAAKLDDKNYASGITAANKELATNFPGGRPKDATATDNLLGNAEAIKAKQQEYDALVNKVQTLQENRNSIAPLLRQEKVLPKPTAKPKPTPIVDKWTSGADEYIKTLDPEKDKEKINKIKNDPRYKGNK